MPIAQSVIVRPSVSNSCPLLSGPMPPKMYNATKIITTTIDVGINNLNLYFFI